MNTNTNDTEAKQPASAGCHPTTCSASLVWHAGPAQGGGGTAQDEMPQDHGYSSWWADGELLLVVVNTNSGPEVSLVRVSADGDQLGFCDPETGDHNWGWMDTDISWWARVMESLPQNRMRDVCADMKIERNLNIKKSQEAYMLATSRLEAIALWKNCHMKSQSNLEKLYYGTIELVSKFKKAINRQGFTNIELIEARNCVNDFERGDLFKRITVSMNNKDLIALAEKIASLNPDFPEIGAGMLKQIHEMAVKCLENHKPLTL